MQIGRREFFKNIGAGGLGAVLLAGTKTRALAAGKEQYGVLADTRNCINCKACQVACKAWNGNAPDPDTYKKSFSFSTWCYVQEEESGKFPKVTYNTIKRQCMHCQDPQCVAACPQEGKAIHREPDGMVVINHENCIRCEACTSGCLYGGVPRLDEKADLIKKCTFCIDRVRKGEVPACVGTCLAGALQFGTAKEISAKAAKAKKQGYTVYGLEKGRLTSWVYVLPKGVTMKQVEAQLQQEASRRAKQSVRAA